MARHGIGRRLATRVVALLSRQLDLTGTALALAAEEPAIAEALLSAELLRMAGDLDEESLRSLARDAGPGTAEILRVVPDPASGWRTIALEDDLLAEQARAEQEPGAEGLSLVRTAPREMTTRESEELFTPEEVARLKLAVLTSQDTDERIEAIRQLVFAPVEGGQKAGILLNVLVDREAEARVRREAIRALEQIGFRSDMADAVRGLFGDEPREAIYAIQRLTALLQEAEAGEAALTLAVVLETFDQSRDPQIIRELLQMTGRCAAVLVGNYGRAEQFIRSAVRHMAAFFDELHAEVEAAVAACAEQAPELTADLLWKELDRSESPRVRSVLLTLCESVTRSESRLAELGRRSVAAILDPALPESEKARLRYGLVRLGEPAVLEALQRIGTAGGVARSELVRLLDVLCTEAEVTDETVRQTVRTLLDLLKLADTATRRIILRSMVLADPRVEPEAQEGLAEELLALCTELNLPDTLDAVQNVLERIGPPAVRPAYEFMRRSYPGDAAARAALAMGSIFQDGPDGVDDRLTGQILQMCMDMLGREQLRDGAFTIALASACGYTGPGADYFDTALESLKEKLWVVPYSLDALDALGIMGGSPNARRAHQQELFELFDGIVRYQPRSSMGRRRETGEGPVYEFGREIEFDIRVVPSAVRGLERICVSDQAAAGMRTDIVKRFLVLWEGVAKVRIVWGPAAVEALIGAMCSAACAPQATTPMKVRLGVSLLRFLNKISVVRSIGLICSQPDPGEPMRELALRAGGELLQQWQDCPVQDVERRFALLDSAGRIAANPALEADDEQVQRLRERGLQALFAGLREDPEQVRAPLLLMRDCPGLRDAQKREIDERVGKALGLVRVGSRA